jgi:hypothetical protein
MCRESMRWRLDVKYPYCATVFACLEPPSGSNETNYREVGYWFLPRSRVTKRTAQRVTEVYRLSLKAGIRGKPSGDLPGSVSAG